MEINKIYQGDCLELMKELPDESIDHIITDPPYGINKEGIENDDSLEVYYKSLKEMFRVLKKDAFLITYASIGRLPDFFKNNPFTYRWQYITYIDNGMVRGSIGFNNYMVTLIFQKGEAKLKRPMKDIMRVSTSSQECAKRKHPTEKDVRTIRRFLECFTKEGDLILDPFIGAGSVAVACYQTGRNFIGMELNQGYINEANKKLNQKVINPILFGKTTNKVGDKHEQ